MALTLNYNNVDKDHQEWVSRLFATNDTDKTYSL